MARFQDYVKEEQIEDEIQEASEGQQARKEEATDSFEIPERFKDKSPEEIAKSYVELEKAFSRQGQDLGTMRKSIDELLTLQSQESEAPPPEEPVDLNDLYDAPEETIGKVVDKKVSNRIEALEKSLQEAKVAEQLAKFESKHEGWRETAKSDEFAQWVQGSPYRMRLAQEADQYDFEAADELFGLYKESRSSEQKVKAEAQRQRELQDAMLESSGPQTISHDEPFSRQNLMEARIAAARGDSSARNWLNANAEAIALAYEEGNIVD